MEKLLSGVRSRATMTLILIGIFALAARVPSAGGQTWMQQADMPGPGRHHPVTFVLNGHGYAATGTTTGAANSDDFYRYDPVGDSWETLPDFPGPDRSYAYGGSYGGMGYLGFGRGLGYLADLWRYDPATAQWTQLTSCPGAGRMHPAFVITDEGKIFVGMGWGAAGNLRDWWEYSIAGDSWTRRADLIGPARHHPYYFNIGNTPYVGFGHGAAAYRDVYRFDPVSLGWTRLADFPDVARLAGTQFSYGGAGYILSGLGPSEAVLPTGEFWAYHVGDDSWFELPPHPGSARWAPGIFLIGDDAYVFAGESNLGLQRDMWKFDMTTSTGVVESPAVPGSFFELCPNPVSGGQVGLVRVPPGFEAAAAELIGADGRRVPGLMRNGPSLVLPPGLVPGQYVVVLTANGGGRVTGKLAVLP